MKQFTISPEGVKEVTRQQLIRSLPFVLLAVAAGIAISSISSKNKKPNVNVLPFIIPLVTLSVGSGLYKGFNRQKKLLASYTLTITNNVLEREQLNTPTITLYFNEVKEIIKKKNGSFTIKGKELTDIIYVPAQVKPYAELERELYRIMPLTNKNKTPLLEKYRSLFSLLTIALMLSVYIAMNKIVVGISGTLITALLVWGFVEARRSKNIDVKTKRSMWWVLVVLVSVVCTTILKLTVL